MGSSESKSQKPSDQPGCFNKSGGKKFDICLATLGLDNAGKTSIVLSLAKELPEEGVLPTVGFDSKKIMLHGHSVTLYDLGGGTKIRGIWKNYLAEVHGIIYVVDASDPARVEESAKEFKTICQNTFVHYKPMLILANKSDKDEALSEYELTERMDLEEIVNVNHIPTKIQASTTTTKDHKTLKEGMKWLYSAIESDWETLEERVKQDILDTKEKQKAERRARMERIRKEKQEKEAVEGPEDEKEEDTGIPEGGDPFQTLDDHLTIKAAEEKLRKESQKKRKSSKKSRTPRENLIPSKENDEDDVEISSSFQSNSLPAKNSKTSVAESEDSTIGRAVPRTNGDSLYKKPERAPSPLPAPFGDGLSSLSSRLPPLGGTLPPLAGSSPLKPLDLFTEETTTKKKKKRKKKTRISPSLMSPDHNGLMPVEEEVS